MNPGEQFVLPRTSFGERVGSRGGGGFLLMCVQHSCFPRSPSRVLYALPSYALHTIQELLNERLGSSSSSSLYDQLVIFGGGRRVVLVSGGGGGGGAPIC